MFMGLDYSWLDISSAVQFSVKQSSKRIKYDFPPNEWIESDRNKKKRKKMEFKGYVEVLISLK